MNLESKGNQTKEQFRVVINREANESLEKFVASLAVGSESSKITKSDLANYIFCRLEEFVGAAQIAEIRILFFDAKKALEGILKGTPQADQLPDDLREAILKHCGIKPSTKEKRQKKLSTPQLVDNSKAG